MPDLSARSQKQEQMDDPGISTLEYAALLADLAKVNALTLAARPILRFLDRLAKPGDRLKILDVGFGHGDNLRRMARWAAWHSIEVDLVGIDLNPRSASVASAATDPDLPIRYRTGDYADLAGEGWDVVVSSLVAHHMTRSQIVGFLRFMEKEARRGWMVNDLHRHAFAYHGFPLLARLMGWHRIVREDGTLSIARAYRPAEWPPLLDAAAITGARVYRAFPFRLCVERLR